MTTPALDPPSTQPAAVQRVYDVLAQKYDREYNTPGARAENATVFSLLRRAGCHRGRVLDLGCGTGLFLEYNQVEPGAYVGIDISAGMLAVARKKFPHHRFYRADMVDLSFLPDESCDSVVSLFASFAYVLEPDRVVAEIRRLLVPGGHFFIQTTGKRYGEGSPEIIAGLGVSLPWRLWSAGELRRQFAPVGRAAVRGMRAVDSRRLRAVPYILARAYLAVETALVGRWWPDLCHYQIVFGSKEQ